MFEARIQQMQRAALQICKAGEEMSALGASACYAAARVDGQSDSLKKVSQKGVTLAVDARKTAKLLVDYGETLMEIAKCYERSEEHAVRGLAGGSGSGGSGQNSNTVTATRVYVWRAMPVKVLAQRADAICKVRF